MSFIHTLPENVCNRIAAGEVIERPASVVKELVENSIDAGATRIAVSVEDAGKKLISVVDDGCGMDGDDALLCFDSHATSKIRNEEDIFAIQSLGFRGEAIPSIASVSKMTIRTRRKGAAEGFEVVVHGGKFIASNPAGCAPGTEVTVRGLFYNLPARKKFLRSAATEEHRIVDCLTNLALAHPEISFELKIDARNVLASAGGAGAGNRLRELFGKTMADAMIPVEKEGGGIRVSGFISRRNYTKSTRGEQRVFVNGRSVDSPSAYRGIRDGYGPMIERGRYPAAILFLTLSPELVDVNVHPAKREVRFRDDFAVIAAVRSAVTAALRAADPVIPPPSSGQDLSAAEFFPKNASGARVIRSLYPDFAPSTHTMEQSGASELQMILKQALVEYQPSARSGQDQEQWKSLSELLRKDAADKPAEGTSEPGRPVEYFTARGNAAPDREEPAFPKQQPDVLPFLPEGACDFPNAMAGAEQSFFQSYRLRILGVMENSYIIGVISNGLVLIDQHAAHERVLFEKILKGTDGTLSQKLLFPIPLELSRADMQFVIRNLSEFEKAGFEIDPFGDQTVKLSAIPCALPQDNAGGVFLGMLENITERGSAQQLQIHTIATAACKAAVKAHDKLTLEECDSLIRDLAKCELPFSCPHGRPTVLNISLNEIEHRFGRK